MLFFQIYENALALALLVRRWIVWQENLFVCGHKFQALSLRFLESLGIYKGIIGKIHLII